MNFLLLTSFGEAATYALYILIAVLLLLVMITVHEAGHYFAGKIFGFGIEEFSIGFGPKIFSLTKKNGERFSVRLIPLGGYCAFTGEDEDINDPAAFNNRKPWQRIIVLIAGAFMNYLTAIIIISLMFGIYGHSAIMAYRTDGAAIYGEEYSLRDRDVIIKADGKTVYLITDLMTALDGKKQGDGAEFYVLRDGEYTTVPVRLCADAEFKNVEDVETLSRVLNIYYAEEDGAITSGFRTTGLKLGFFATVGRSFEYSFKLAGTVFTVFRQLFTGMLGIKSVGGTITTINVAANAIRAGGVWSFLNISAFIGVNLAVFNLIPFPALDGSRVVFTLIEWIRGKPLKRRIEGIIHAVGFAIILCFAVFVDLQGCF
ncbi:MAG: site-2 protease family protein [Clostridia bacterium]|nr:site-2 protease family protein [Clostridia bacterium]